MPDRDLEGKRDDESTEPPTGEDSATILGGDPDAVTTTSHDIIKSGFDDSLPDDADDVSLVPAAPIASPRVGEGEHVVPAARRRWWFPHHHHREPDSGGPDAKSGATGDPLAWLQPEPKATSAGDAPGSASTSVPDAAPDAASGAESEQETRDPHQEKRRD